MCGFCVSKEIINMEHYEGKIVGTKKVDIVRTSLSCRYRSLLVASNFSG